MLTPLITEIQRFSLHDGPGIRTTIFLKGCPLNCTWCHNPEAMNQKQELYFHSAKCTACGRCAQVCPSGALTLDQALDRKEVRNFDRSKCTLCLKCVDACLSGAIEVVGKNWDIDSLVREAVSDKLFYAGGGGVTISGGDPLLFPEFTLELARLLKNKENVHVAIETSCFAKWNKIEPLLEFVDLFMVDIKSMDPKKYKDVVGCSLHEVLSNVEILMHSNANVRIRLPIIPGFNDSASDVKAYVDYLGQFAGKLSGVDILPFHSYAAGKYSNLGREYQYDRINDLASDQVMPLVNALQQGGLQVTVGGVVSMSTTHDTQRGPACTAVAQEPFSENSLIYGGEVVNSERIRS